MHDFCFTIPYGVVLVIGGLIGYAKKRSIASLGGGFGTGFLLILAGYISLQCFHKRRNSWFSWTLQTVVAASLTWVMTQRYLATSKVMPAGMIAGISAIMTLFYVYKFVNGGNHFPPKTEKERTY